MRHATTPLTYSVQFLKCTLYTLFIFQIINIHFHIILYLWMHQMSNYYHIFESKIITKIPDGVINFELTNLNHVTCIIIIRHSSEFFIKVVVIVNISGIFWLYWVGRINGEIQFDVLIKGLHPNRDDMFGNLFGLINDSWETMPLWMWIIIHLEEESTLFIENVLCLLWNLIFLLDSEHPELAIWSHYHGCAISLKCAGQFWNVFFDTILWWIVAYHHQNFIQVAPLVLKWKILNSVKTVLESNVYEKKMLRGFFVAKIHIFCINSVLFVTCVTKWKLIGVPFYFKLIFVIGILF